MLKAQNTHLHLNAPISTSSKLLKFCYFIGCFFLISCGNTTTEKETKETATQSKSLKTEETAATNTKTILCFGDSLTAGYGLSDAKDAYPAVLQQKITDLGFDYTVVNSGVSGETSAGGKSRIDWILNQEIAVFLLELGANDGLRGVPIAETHANLQSIITTVQEKSPTTKIILAGMELPPNMGQEYTQQFKQIFTDLANKNAVAFIPFILKDVGGIAELNQADGIHPTAAGHKIMATTVWETLQPLLK